MAEDIEVRQLRYFVEAAATGSMSQAARRLFVSQQALSKGVASLEVALGAPLFVREKSGVALTDFGRFFLKRAKLALETLDFARESYRDFSHTATRTIALGMPSLCLSELGGTLSPERLYRLQKAYPHIVFEFVEEGAQDLCEQLESGTLQFAIGCARDERTYRNALLGEYPLVVIVSRENPLSRRAQFTLTDLATGQLVAAPDDRTTATLLVELGRQAGVELRVSPLKVSSVDAASLIVDPSMFAVQPEQHARRTTSTERVTLVPLVGLDGAQVTVGLYLTWRADLRLQEPERALIDYITTLYAHRDQEE